MEFVIESKSPKRELEEVAKNEPVNKKQCLESNSELKCPDQIEQKNKDESNMVQLESNPNTENIQNNCEAVLNFESNAEAQKDILCPMAKDIGDDNRDNHYNSEKKSDNENNLNKNSENMAIGDIENHKNEKSTEVESNDLSASNQDPEPINTDNAADGNQASVQNPDQASSSSSQIQLREKCKYGSRCYRLNAEHKAKFSHYGDADFDNPDNRPECPYGVLCYRKNPQHKLDFKHTQTKRIRTQNRGETVRLEDLSDFEDSMEESVDESEYDDSFIDDDDLDDEFDSDLEFDDLDDDSSDDEDNKKKKTKKKKNETKEKKKKKSKDD